MGGNVGKCWSILEKSVQTIIGFRSGFEGMFETNMQNDRVGLKFIFAGMCVITKPLGIDKCRKLSKT